MKIKMSITILAVLFAFWSTSCSWFVNPLGGKQTTALYPIRQNNKNGYINRQGEVVIQPQFDVTFPFSEGLAMACISSKKCGYIDETGKFAVNPQFDSAYRFSEGLAAVVVGEKLGFIDKEGKYAINPQFATSGGGRGADGYSTFSEGMSRVKIGEKVGFIDKTGKIVINPQFDDALPFLDGLAATKTGDKWGFVDKEGKIVINPQFEHAQPFVNGLAAVLIGKQYGYIDKQGKIVINPQFEAAMPFSDEGLAAVAMNEKIGFIDKEGKYVVNPQFGRGGLFIIDVDSAFLITSDLGRISFSEGLAPVQVGDKRGNIGYADKTGKIVINPQFQVASPFYGGLAVVINESASGGGEEMAWIDKDGKIVWREVKETSSSNSNANVNTNTSVNSNTATVNTNSTANIANTANKSSTQSSKTTEYEGTLNNNHEITMRLTRSGDSLSGYVVPKTSGTSIPVRGTINSSGEFNLSEYDDKDNWTGSYKGTISSDGRIEGTWSKPDGTAERPLSLREK
jgi:hypothetical protein